MSKRTNRRRRPPLHAVRWPTRGTEQDVDRFLDMLTWNMLHGVRGVHWDAPLEVVPADWRDRMERGEPFILEA